MDRIIGKHNLTQDLRLGDKVEVYDAHKFKENEDGTIELGDKITEGIVVDYTSDYTTSGLVTLDSSEKELIVGEHNFKLIEEGNLQAVYDSVSKNKVESLSEDYDMYRKLLGVKSGELEDIAGELEYLVRQYNSKVDNYNGLLTLSREKARELSLLTGDKKMIPHMKNKRLELGTEADF
ncbi:hypothetical protein F867_gp090 [Staphylococcus phage JD007]|uniref:Uncharacterized protein n=1 Tax=Staphylococcus phage JD007 TaxID=1239383 RepID=K7QNH9_9CAUD|nr:hypothetical protein F867_gp090 [Staphylococcus phage JD007]AFV50760.1 hypothetical protein [Staphylococcus phage JD007]